MASAQATAAPLAALPDFAQDLGHGVYAIATDFNPAATAAVYTIVVMPDASFTFEEADLK